MTWKDEYDLILIRTWKRGATDSAIHAQMADMGLQVSRADIIVARRRLCLKPHFYATAATPEPPPPKEKPNPRIEATIWLGKRLKERDGTYYLDGVPTKFYPDVVKAINRQRKRAGVEQLSADPAWVV